MVDKRDHNILLCALYLFSIVVSFFNPCLSSFDKQVSFTSVTHEQFTQAIDEFAQTFEHTSACSQWLGNKPSDDFFNVSAKSSFNPYAQRLTVPIGASCALWGDLHGSFVSLNKTLLSLYQHGWFNDDLTLRSPYLYLIFLGDYVDRGPDGIAVLYLLMKLKVANPNQVVLLRGNHEDLWLNSYGAFGKQLRTTLNCSEKQLYDLVQKIGRLYDLFPVVLYLCAGVNPMNVIMCAHGGLEIGFDPLPLLRAPEGIRFELINELRRADYLKKIPGLARRAIRRAVPEQECRNIRLAQADNSSLGFLWHDFCADDNITVRYNRGRGWAYSRKFVRAMLDYYSSADIRLRAIIRGHQHHNENGLRLLDMLIAIKGIANPWRGLVYTMISSWPFNNPVFSSYCVLSTSFYFDQWRFSHWNV